jgi:hypothetical protein
METMIRGFWLWLAFAAVLALMSAGGARAGVAILHDGADGAPAVIRIQSGIRKGDFEQFMAAVDRVGRATATRINGVPFITVELNSPGGDVVEAVEIGRAIAARFMMTTVRASAECVSACVFILMAGAVHTPADGAAIGVHRPLLVSWRNMSAQSAHEKYDALMTYLRAYFQQLGISDAAYALMMRTGANDMHYFSSADLDRLGLRGEDPAWEGLYGLRWAEGAPKPIQPRAALAAAPSLPPVDPSWRYVVFMPGDGVEADTLPVTPPAGWRLQWSDLDSGAASWFSQDQAGSVALLRALADGVIRIMSGLWWLAALIAFEIWRPKGLQRRFDAAESDGWRLGPLR